MSDTKNCPNICSEPLHYTESVYHTCCIKPIGCRRCQSAVCRRCRSTVDAVVRIWCRTDVIVKTLKADTCQYRSQRVRDDRNARFFRSYCIYIKLFPSDLMWFRMHKCGDFNNISNAVLYNCLRPFYLLIKFNVTWLYIRVMLNAFRKNTVP